MKQNDRKLDAIMFTDIVGFSRLMTENESEALVLLIQKDSLLKPLIQRYKGQFVKIWVMVVFLILIQLLMQ